MCGNNNNMMKKLPLDQKACMYLAIALGGFSTECAPQIAPVQYISYHASRNAASKLFQNIQINSISGA